jgi:hypothetical protein
VSDKVRRRRTKKPAGFSGSVASLPTPIHAFTPVYIQSGQPSASESNPLLRYIQDIHHKMTNQHEEHLENGLLKQFGKPRQGTQGTQVNPDDIPDEIPASTPTKGQFGSTPAGGHFKFDEKPQQTPGKGQYDGTFATPRGSTPVGEKNTSATKSFDKLHDYGNGLTMRGGEMRYRRPPSDPDISSVSGNEHAFQQVRHQIRRRTNADGTPYYAGVGRKSDAYKAWEASQRK